MAASAAGVRAAGSRERASASAGARAPKRTPRVDLGHYVPTIVSSFADRMLASSVAFLRDNYGINRLEWRVLSYLVSREGAPSAYRIWNEINADKGAISRTLQSLGDKGLVRVHDVAGGRRRTRVRITARGRRLQAATVDPILARQRALLDGVSAAEVDVFLDIIKRLEANIPKMDAAAQRVLARRALKGRASTTLRTQ